MEFVIPSGGNVNLPKELSDKIVNDAIEKSIFLKLISLRGHIEEVPNEKTLTILGEADSSKIYSGSTIADVTTENEMDFAIKPINLDPQELVTYIRLTTKQKKMYTQFRLQEVFEEKLVSAMSKTSDEIALNGDTTITPAKERLNNSDGIVKLANLTNADAAPVGYTTSNAAHILNVVSSAQNDIGVLGDAEYLDDLFLFASPAFAAAAKKSADKNMVGYDIEDYAPLGLRKVTFIHGIPIIKRSLITGEKAILANIGGAYMGRSENMEIDQEHSAGRRSDLYVLSYYTDFKWAFKSGAGKNKGLITIQKSS